MWQYGVHGHHQKTWSQRNSLFWETFVWVSGVHVDIFIGTVFVANAESTFFSQQIVHTLAFETLDRWKYNHGQLFQNRWSRFFTDNCVHACKAQQSCCFHNRTTMVDVTWLVSNWEMLWDSLLCFFDVFETFLWWFDIDKPKIRMKHHEMTLKNVEFSNRLWGTNVHDVQDVQRLCEFLHACVSQPWSKIFRLDAGHPGPAAAMVKQRFLKWSLNPYGVVKS